VASRSALAKERLSAPPEYITIQFTDALSGFIFLSLSTFRITFVTALLTITSISI
jgi:hypothetical protein